MEAPINRAAAGLLSLLDIKSMGKTPRFLAGQVAPIVDMFPLYAEYEVGAHQGSIVGAGTVANGAAGGRFLSAVSSTLPFDGTGVAVPAGEIWWLRQMSMSVNLLAGDIGISVAPAIWQQDLNGGFFPLVDPVFQATGGVVGTEARGSFTGSIFLKPGVRLAAVIGRTEIAANRTVSWFARILRLQV